MSRLDVARQILTDWGQQLREAREHAGMSYGRVNNWTSISAQTLAEFELGRKCPNVEAQKRLEDLFPSLAATPAGSTSARFTDTAASHTVVRSIDRDPATMDAYLEAAATFPTEFDDRDICDWLNEHRPRKAPKHWEHGKLSRARGRYIANHPDGPLRFVAKLRRLRDGRELATKHFDLQKEGKS